MIKRLNEAWAARAPELPLATPYEALILASIVEKETAAPAERQMVASVFVNRLKLGMRLQTDPTVIYGMGERYAGNIHRRDLTDDTPWNTYTRDGLPPTPIAMPGAEALRAAVHPAATEYLYFVAKGDGSHQFSRTLDEHNRAVARYQLHRRAPALPVADGGRGDGMAARGKLITLEGIDGAGKSSHVQFLRERIAERGLEVEVTREPGGTPFGDKLREVVLHHRAGDAAGGSHHHVRGPQRARGRLDRAAPVLRRLGALRPLQRLDLRLPMRRRARFPRAVGSRGALERLVHPGLQPDATFLFDLDPALAYERQRGPAAPRPTSSSA